MDKSIISVYLEFPSRCGLCYIYVPAEEIDIEPGEIFKENTRYDSGNWFIRLYMSGRKSGKKQRKRLTPWMMMNREITYYSEIVKLKNWEVEELIPEKIPFFAIRGVIKKSLNVPSDIIYGDTWK